MRFISLLICAGFLSAGLATAFAQDDDTAPEVNNGAVDNLLQQFQGGNTDPATPPAVPGPPAAPLKEPKDDLSRIAPASPNNMPPASPTAPPATPDAAAPALGPDGLPILPSQPATYEDQPTARLRALDKVTGRTSTFDIPVGHEFNFGKLTIAVRTCKKRPPIEPPESAVFLQIVEKKQDKAKDFTPVFSGWMFASSPSLSALEHPVYDVWLVECVGK